MKKNKWAKLLVISVIIVLTTLVGGCSKEKTTIRLGTMPTYSAAIYAVGIEKGFFEEEGITVDLTVFKSALDRDAAVSAGELDGSMTDIMGAVNLNAKGFPLTMTSAEYEDFGILSGPNFDQSAEEVPTVGISENTVVDFMVDHFMTEPVEKVNIVAVPDRMGALLAGNIRYGVFPQPFMGIILSKGGQLSISSAGEKLQPVVVAFDTTFLNKHEKAVKAFYKGYKKAVEYMQANDYAAYKDALVTHGIATAETVDLFRLPVDEYGLHSVDVATYDSIVSWMKEKQILTQDMDFNTIQSTKYIEE